MNKARLIWGILCLVLAAILTTLNFTLPPDSMMFSVGETNMPFLPPIVLGIVGIVLLATAWTSQPEETQEKKPEAKTEKVVDSEKVALNKRLETIGWGCFLILLALTLIPNAVIPRGVWSIGVGAIMLGLNLARYFYKIKMSGFTTFLGILALISGIFQLFTPYDLDAVVLLLILGAYLIIKPWFDKRQLFGKAEES